MVPSGVGYDWLAPIYLILSGFDLKQMHNNFLFLVQLSQNAEICKSVKKGHNSSGLFCEWAQPMRDDVTL